MLSSWEIKMVQLLKLTLRVTCGDLGVLLSSDTVSATPCTLSIPWWWSCPMGKQNLCHTVTVPAQALSTSFLGASSIRGFTHSPQCNISSVIPLLRAFTAPPARRGTLAQPSTAFPCLVLAHLPPSSHLSNSHCSIMYPTGLVSA